MITINDHNGHILTNNGYSYWPSFCARKY